MKSIVAAALLTIFIAPTATAASIIEGMVYVNGGCFDMGDTFGDGQADEKPVHSVCVDDFYMGKYEVTLGEFRQFVNGTNYRTEAETDGGCYVPKDGKIQKDSSITWKNPGFQQTDRDPAVCISWNDANEFVTWKSKTTGDRYRLPTEAEWEYAARSGGKKYKYSWGNGNPSGNIADESGKRKFPGWTIWNGYDDGFVYTSPVGIFGPNEIGLYDMTGNVWEWTGDWYDERFYRDSPKDDPKGPSGGTTRVLRGGAWNYNPGNSRVAYRGRNYPDYSYTVIGFRFAKNK